MPRKLRIKLIKDPSGIPRYTDPNRQILRHDRRNNKKNKSQLCNYIKNLECWKGDSCPYAHSQAELKLDYYSKNKSYKEKPCNLGKECNRKNCVFYHDISERRFSITIQNLSYQGEYEKSKWENKTPNWFISKQWLKISEAIPYLTFFDEKESKELAERIISLTFAQRTIIAGIEINLVQQRSNIENNSKWNFIDQFKTIQNFSFKSKEICYFRIGTKRQLYFIVNSKQFVDNICSDIKERKPTNLKLIVQSVGKDWGKITQLLKTIHSSSGSLYKLELDIREMIGSVDLPVLEKLFRDSLIPLKKLRAIKLKLDFDFIEYNGSYEKDTVDIALELLRDIVESTCRGIDVSLSMFGIVVVKKGRCIEIKSEPSRRRSLTSRRQLTRRLSYWNLHCHLIRGFSQIFVEKKDLESIVFDFSFIYGLVEKNQGKRDLAAQKYNKEISFLLNEVKSILQHVKDKSLVRFQLSFFKFSFLFQTNFKERTSYFKFTSGCYLPGQNKPIGSFKQMGNLAQLVRQKLNLKYKYDILEGNVFAIMPEETVDKENPKHTMIQGNALYLSKVMGAFNSLKLIKTSSRETRNLGNLLIQTKRLIPLNLKIYPQTKVRTSFQRIIEVNNELSLFRSRVLAVLRAIKQIRKKHSQFIFRKEVIQEIMKMMRLSGEDIEKVISKLKNIRQRKQQMMIENPWSYLTKDPVLNQYDFEIIEDYEEGKIGQQQEQL